MNVVTYFQSFVGPCFTDNLLLKGLACAALTMNSSKYPAHNFDFKAWLGIGERPNHKQNFKHHPDYEKLSPIFQAEFSPKEYAWMPDFERARFEDVMCLPEVEED